MLNPSQLSRHYYELTTAKNTCKINDNLHKNIDVESIGEKISEHEDKIDNKMTKNTLIENFRTFPKGILKTNCMEQNKLKSEINFNKLTEDKSEINFIKQTEEGKSCEIGKGYFFHSEI